MTLISDEEMTRLKGLARLELSPEETTKVKADLNTILDYFEELRGLDTDNVDELTRPVSSVNVFREDEVRPGLTHEEALALGVETEEGFYRVPRTLE
jgi:aspartyl-tRNA(Asn)/glutamyl-tRNA(Gln) amidotransferase subunit C